MKNNIFDLIGTLYDFDSNIELVITIDCIKVVLDDDRYIEFHNLEGNDLFIRASDHDYDVKKAICLNTMQDIINIVANWWNKG